MGTPDPQEHPATRWNATVTLTDGSIIRRVYDFGARRGTALTALHVCGFAGSLCWQKNVSSVLIAADVPDVRCRGCGVVLAEPHATYRQRWPTVEGLKPAEWCAGCYRKAGKQNEQRTA